MVLIKKIWDTFLTILVVILVILISIYGNIMNFITDIEMFFRGVRDKCYKK